MPHTSCLGRPSLGALATLALVGQTSHSRSVSAWRAGVQSGHTPPGTPLRTGLWISSLSAVASQSLSPHSKHGHRLRPVPLGARRLGAWRPPTGCRHPRNQVWDPRLEPPVWGSNRATPPWVGASGWPGGNDPTWRPLPDSCTRVQFDGLL